ncbi:MAG TPA: PQQ-binding-like beta-propeller repeat protein [Verrucomicrobiales bacterium]|nr:PQQ-binding-like beta-propeller repeat protein [Verrucomicrobiales bacterium]
MMNPSHLCAVLALSVLTTLAIDADDWPQWRGPDANSVAKAGAYPTKFSPTENVIWKVKLPGVGSSTPMVLGEQIFVTCGNEGRDGVLAYDWKGEVLWQKTLGTERPGKHKNGSGANSSPITDGKNIIVYFKSGTVASLTLDGKLNWQTNLQEKYGEDTLWWDLGTSPVFAGGNIVIAVMQEGASYVVALNPEDGTEAWKVDRTFPVQKESGQSYTTPYLTTIDGKEMLVIWGADRLTGHDPKDGRTIWSCGGFNPEDKAMWRVIASPGFSDGIAVVPYGRTKFCAGVKLGGSGDITASARLWERSDLGADCPTPVAHEGRAYVLSDRGQINCIDLKTGKDIWVAAIPRASANFYSSPILAGDLLFCAREDGVVAVVKVNDTGMEVLAENAMGERLAAAPVPVRDRLLIRGVDHLYCLGAQ